MISTLPTQASGLIFSDITIGDLNNNAIELHWNTNQTTIGTVYFGTNPDNLYRSISTNLYAINHTSHLTGLESDSTYYYKVVARNRSGQQIESFIKSFETGEILSGSKPEIYDVRILQTTGDVIALWFASNKETRGIIEYGYTSTGNLDQTTYHRQYVHGHTVYIFGLEPMTKYNIRIIAEDKNGRKDYHRINNVKTSSKTNHDYNKMIIDNIRPISPNSDMITSHSATFTFKTNLLSHSYIEYGTSPGNYSARFQGNGGMVAIDHEITIENLKPDTRYYYRIFTEHGLYNKNSRIEEQTFTTRIAPQVLGQVITSDNADNDHDGLSNNYELALGTDRNNPDTDGDGYNDGLEIKNGYDPLGPGKFKVFKYNKPRLDSAYEMSKSIELKEGLENILGSFNLRTQDWFTAVNAYVYGEYPIEAVAQSIKHGGKTVHPNIAWDFWQKAKDYLNYINL